MDEPPTTARRRRRAAALALVIAVSLVAVIAGVWATIALRHHNTPAAAAALPRPHGTSTAPSSSGTGPSPVNSPSAPPSRQRARLAACRGDQFIASIGSSGGNATQHYVVISLRNTSSAGCSLSGYPRLSITAQSATGTAPARSTSIRHGSVADRADPGAQRLAVDANASTSFVLGVPDPTGAHQYSITQVRVSLPHDSVSIPVYLSLTGSAHGRQPMPATVTAFVAGANGPQ